MILQGTGVLKLDLTPRTKKHIKQSSWKYTACISINHDFYEYYQWFIQAKFGLVLNKPIREAHLTVINDKLDPHIWDKLEELKNTFNNKQVVFSYDPSLLRTDGTYWWIKADAAVIPFIRKKFDLNPVPYFAPHITIGVTNQKYQIETDSIIEYLKKYYND